MRIVVARDATSAARAAAEFIGDRLTHALARERSATLALSGGRAATALFEALAEQPLPWQAIDVFQVDERIVPSDHLARNWGLLARSPQKPHEARDFRSRPQPVEPATNRGGDEPRADGEHHERDGELDEGEAAR